MVERWCKHVAAALLRWFKLETLMELDTKTSNSTHRCKHKFNNANWKDSAKARSFMGWGDLNPNSIFGFFVVYRYEHRCNLDYENCKSHRATWNLIPLDRAKVSDLSMRSWYVNFVGGVRAWRSDYTCDQWQTFNLSKIWVLMTATGVICGGKVRGVACHGYGGQTKP
jgi:hypothetical protein